MDTSPAPSTIQSQSQRNSTRLTQRRRFGIARRPFLARSSGFSGANSPRAILEECLEEVARWEPIVAAFTAMDVEAARRAADESTARWRGGQERSAIDGIVVGVKDMIDTSDLPTGMGSPLYDGYTPRFDTASVQGLREAGAVILGWRRPATRSSSSPTPIWAYQASRCRCWKRKACRSGCNCLAV